MSNGRRGHHNQPRHSRSHKERRPQHLSNLNRDCPYDARIPFQAPPETSSSSTSSQQNSIFMAREVYCIETLYDNEKLHDIQDQYENIAHVAFYLHVRHVLRYRTKPMDELYITPIQPGYIRAIIESRKNCRPSPTEAERQAFHQCYRDVCLDIVNRLADHTIAITMEKILNYHRTIGNRSEQEYAAFVQRQYQYVLATNSIFRPQGM